jgi:ABC-type glutathione transport system ATPase component
MTAPLLEVRGLSIGYRDALGKLTPAVEDMSFQLEAGAAIGIVGESGSGKSTAARALLGYYRGASECTKGEIRVNGRNISHAAPRALAALRGIEVAFVPQNPLSSLTYHLRVGAQLIEILRTRAALSPVAARRRALELFAATRLPDPAVIFERYPHQLSGGQRQRVVIAFALACRPALLVLDEPTTALDKTTETQVLELVQELRAEIGAGLVLVTHDLNVVASLSDQVLVMQQGRVVEQGATAATFAQPKATYTRTLLDSVLRLGPVPSRPPTAGDAPVLEARGLGHSYRRNNWFSRRPPDGPPALAAVSFTLNVGEMVGVIGESGSGKSTLGAIVAGLTAPSQGQLLFRGQPLAAHSAGRSADTRRQIQIIFQDPLSSLNPRQTVLTAVARPIQFFFGVDARQARRRAAALLGELGLGGGIPDPFSKAALGRPAAAGGDRARLRGRTRDHCLRRNYLGAGRLDPGSGARCAATDAAAARSGHARHHARPGGGVAASPAGAGASGRRGARAGLHGRGFCRPAVGLHALAAAGLHARQQAHRRQR